jgi:TolB-like protein/class 3 adenylate cyclase
MAEAKRILAAILAADVAGYSRLMGDDERATVDMLNVCRKIFRKHISDHDGRVVDTAGDSVLAVFGSVVEAVQCAVEVQEELYEHNAHQPEDRRMLFRVGIHSGDVIEQDDGTVYGDGVNVAARLESLATPGRISVSEDAYRNVQHKLDLAFEDLGAHAVKNIVEPVRAYQTGHGDAASEGYRRGFGAVRDSWRPLGAASVVIVLGVVGAWWFSPSISPESRDPSGPGASIVVLPFENLSGDAGQDYLAEGMSVEIITALSRFRELFVIDRNSSFAAEVRDMPLMALGEELGVRYVLEGNLRRDEDRLRLTIRLLETEQGRQMWTESYDETIDNIFDVQDRITRQVASSIAPRISEQEMRRAASSRDTSIEAYDVLMRGNYLLGQATRASYFSAREILADSLDLYTDHAGLNVAYARALINGIWYGWTPVPEREMALVMEHLNRAIATDPDHADAHRVLGEVYSSLRQHDLALIARERAVALNPNQAKNYDGLGDTLIWLCRFEEAATALEMAVRFDPLPHPSTQFSLGLTYYFLGRHQAAAIEVGKCNDRYPDFPECHVVGAAVNAELGRPEIARVHAAEVRRLDPFFDSATYGSMLTCAEPALSLRQSLREGGLE